MVHEKLSLKWFVRMGEQLLAYEWTSDLLQGDHMEVYLRLLLDRLVSARVGALVFL